MRLLAYEETGRLAECLEALAAHHNEVSVHFRGAYPKRPYEDTLASFREDVRGGRSRIAVIEEGKILGFCKIDIDGADGKLDYLVVLKEARGKGYGGLLLVWALDAFRDSGVRRIELRVVDGNDAAGFYEKYGFRINSHVMRLDL